MRSSARDLLSRLTRLTVVAALAGVLLPARPAPAETPSAYHYWFAHPQSKVLPTSLAGSARSCDSTPAALALSAARGEAEGRQVVLRAGLSSLKDVWIEAGELSSVDASGVTHTMPASSAVPFKVHYVRISSPSYGSSYRGLAPDPLLPMTLANGERLGWNPGGAAPDLSRRGVKAGTTQPFYLLFTVPEDATAGTYTGTVTVTAKLADGSPAPTLYLPVRLTVYPFSVAARTLKTSFGIHMRAAAYANSASHQWLGRNPDPGPGATRVAERTTYKGDQWGGWLKYFSDHRISPQAMLPAWENGSDWAPPADNGYMEAREDHLHDYLATGDATTFEGRRFAFNTVRMPEGGAPSYVKNPFSSSWAQSKAATYYSSMHRELGPYASRAYAYPIDEPAASQRAFVEKYAAFVHRHAPKAKFLLTTDPVTMKYKPLRGVDIYVQRMHFFFRDYSKWVRPLRNSGKSVWIYTHATSWQGKVPNFLIDEALTESRTHGWFAWRTRAPGLLYFSVNAWRPNQGSSAYRDPYVDLISFRGRVGDKPLYANGDGSLIYPGYYPRLGLHVQGSAPVGSLRMEALRDGLEDYEYLKLVSKKSGTTAADRYAARIIGSVPAPKAGRLQFPSYKTSTWYYDDVRADMAAVLSR